MHAFLIRAALVAAFLMALALFAWANRAAAQTVCGPRVKFLTHLEQNYDERPAAMGVTSLGEIVEVLISEKRSWTIIVTHPSGRTCLVAAGEAWERIKRTAQEKAPL